MLACIQRVTATFREFLSERAPVALPAWQPSAVTTNQKAGAGEYPSCGGLRAFGSPSKQISPDSLFYCVKRYW